MQLGRLVNNCIYFLFLAIIPLLVFSHSNYLKDNYTVIKWSLLYFIVPYIFVTGAFTRKKIYLPILNKYSQLLLILLAIFYINMRVFANPVTILQTTLDTGLFISLILIVVNIFKINNETLKHFKIVLILSGLLSVVISILQYVGFNFITTWDPKYAATFGNPNMLAEFLGFSWIAMLWLNSNSKYSLTLKHIGIFLCTMCLWLLNCRSVLLAIIIILVIQRKKISEFKLIVVQLLIAFCLTHISYFSIEKHGSDKDTVSVITNKAEANTGSTYHRFKLWKASILLIYNNFFKGIGPGELEFDFIPYLIAANYKQHENEVEISPHNEFLRFTAEYGAFYATIGVLLIFSIFKNNYVKSKDTVDGNFIISLFIYFLIESFLQFPLLNALSFFNFTIMLGLMLKNQSEEFELKIPSRILLIGFSFLLMYISLARFYSNYYQENYKNYDEIRNACKYFPANWRACDNFSQYNISTGKFAEAESTLLLILKSSPYNFSVLSSLSYLYWEMGDIKKSCDYAKKYVYMFDKLESSVTKFYFENCRNKYK